MNQLFYNIAGKIVHQIRRDAKNGQQYQKCLFAVSEILSKIGVGFISNFLLKTRVLYLTISTQKNLSLPLKVKIDHYFFLISSNSYNHYNIKQTTKLTVCYLQKRKGL